MVTLDQFCRIPRQDQPHLEVFKLLQPIRPEITQIMGHFRNIPRAYSAAKYGAGEMVVEIGWHFIPKENIPVTSSQVF